VAVLSRGYRGSFRGECLVVSDGDRVLASAAEAGDEPVMLARQLPGVVVAVGRRRARPGRLVESRFGPRVHVLDDGFQHLPLHRDLDLVCLEDRDLDDAPLPGGRLREAVSALARADLLLLAGSPNADEAGRRAATFGLRPERVLRLARRAVGFFTRDGAAATPPRRPFLLAAIAEPLRLRESVLTSVPVGLEIAGTAFFRDHHRFSAAELQRVARSAAEAGADAVVTTAKDEVRLPSGLEFGRPLLVLRVEAAIDREDVLRERLRALGRAA
jgi:tetraacyldisaccharide 4'-kinase